MLEEAFEHGIEVWDHHTHLGGMGTEGSGCYVNPVMRSPLRHPLNYVKMLVFSAAAGVDIGSRTFDADYVERLVRLIDTIRPRTWRKHFLLALDKWHDLAGRPVLERTALHVPNEYVMQVAAAHPAHFVPAISVHPYRRDAVAEIDRFAALAVRMVKWLPPTMNIDMSSNLCRPFYEALARHNMILLVHVGKEHTTDIGQAAQALANPLLLRYPLDAGVKVIAAHCASEGKSRDFDAPARNVQAENFDLFLRLMDDPRYQHRLFADISSITAVMRLGKPLTTMLNRVDLHPRLVNGSDYPLPAVNMVVQTSALERHGYINKAQRGYLNEIYKRNPLAFDFVTKRALRSPDRQQGFSPCVFGWNERLFGPKPPG
jgi:predicted TIM-barrel fold metal-dependent hydrolase